MKFGVVVIVVLMFLVLWLWWFVIWIERLLVLFRFIGIILVFILELVGFFFGCLVMCFFDVMLIWILNVFFIVLVFELCFFEKGFFFVVFGIFLKVVFVFVDFDEVELDFEICLNFFGFFKIKLLFFKEVWLKILMYWWRSVCICFRFLVLLIMWVNVFKCLIVFLYFVFYVLLIFFFLGSFEKIFVLLFFVFLLFCSV